MRTIKIKLGATKSIVPSYYPVGETPTGYGIYEVTNIPESISNTEVLARFGEIVPSQVISPLSKIYSFSYA